MESFLKKITFTCSILLALHVSVFAVNISDVEVAQTIEKNGTALVLNGAGVRDKFFIDLYIGALYLKDKSSDAKTILSADEAMSIKLFIISSLITSEKMENSTRVGFQNSMDGNTEPLKQQIEEFISVFKEEIKEGDVYEFEYTQNSGVNIYKNNTLTKNIKGIEFKKALFGIWLSNTPAQESLKEDMLGL